MADVDLTDQLPLSQNDKIIECLSQYILATDQMLALMSVGSRDTVALVHLAVQRGNAKGMAIYLGYLWPGE
jgi:hypothetical protein